MWMVTAIMKLKDLTPWKESYNNPRQYIKKVESSLPINVHMVKAMVFPIVMYGCETIGKEVVLLDWKNILYFYLKYWKSIADYQEG